jgi:hypothetical protein
MIVNGAFRKKNQVKTMDVEKHIKHTANRNHVQICRVVQSIMCEIWTFQKLIYLLN